VYARKKTEKAPMGASKDTVSCQVPKHNGDNEKRRPVKSASDRGLSNPCRGEKGGSNIETTE